MEKTALTSNNLIRESVNSRQVGWKWPLMLVFSRLFFALVVQALVAVLFFGASTAPYQAAGEWWPVYGTLIDVGCLILVMRQIQKEGLGFLDLLNFDASHFWRDALVGFGYILWVFPLAMIGVISCSILIFGSPQPPSIYHPLPVWAAAYSLLIFPVIWGTIEQCTYQGYILPRLEALFRRAGPAIALVAFGWGIQHIALPFMLDWRYMLYRFLSFLPLAVAMSLVYRRTRRLIPFIIAHWAVDMLAVLSGIVVPILMK